MSLKKLRTRIDRLDWSLLNLLNERGLLVQSIGAIKEKTRQSVFAPGREREIFLRLKQNNPGPLSAEAVESVFREVVHVCRNLEKKLRVGYLGPEATFTHQAALRSFGRSAELHPIRTIPDVFSEVEKARADFGVVPIENSTEGVVNHTLDMFVDSTLSICAELELPISHYLLGDPGRYRGGAGAKVIYTHYQALAQCRHWLEAHLPKVPIVEVSSTAEAAVRASRSKSAVAVSSRLAAELYGMDILASRIEDVSRNSTRFLVIGKNEPSRTGRDKTSLMISIKDRVGALYDMLLPFKRFKLNMTKIESRPTRQRAWEYIFFVDILGHRSDPPVQKVLKLLERSSVFIKVLGSYPRTE